MVNYSVQVENFIVKTEPIYLYHQENVLGVRIPIKFSHIVTENAKEILIQFIAETMIIHYFI
jgi:hypothetical protein